MKRRDWLLGAISFAGAAILLLLAIRTGRVQPALMAAKICHAAPLPVIILLVLTGLHIFLSNQKWRLVDAVLRTPADAAPSRTESFGITAVGVALGQVLPLQLGVVVGRTVGTHLFGRPFSRGAVGSVFEQGFDALVMLMLAISSCIVLSVHGGALLWVTSSGVVCATAFLVLGPIVNWLRRLGTVGWLGRRLSEAANRYRSADLLELVLTRRLTALSFARFGVLILMAAAICASIHVRIPLWQLTASIPLVTLACVLIVTPGGIGISELGYAGVLHAFGTPVGQAVEWAIGARILISGACFIIAAFAVVWACLSRSRSRKKYSSLNTADLACGR